MLLHRAIIAVIKKRITFVMQYMYFLNVSLIQMGDKLKEKLESIGLFSFLVVVVVGGCFASIV